MAATRLMSGTSFAAPQVAGAEALVVGLNKALQINGHIVDVASFPDSDSPTATDPPITPEPGSSATPETTTVPNQQVELALSSAIASEGERLAWPGTRLEVDQASLKVSGDWGIVFVDYLSLQNKSPTGEEPSLLILHWDTNGWSVAFPLYDNATRFNAWLDALPAELATGIDRSLWRLPETVSPQEYSLRTPFIVSARIIQGHHDGNAIDFGINGGIGATVVAAASGTVVYVKQNSSDVTDHCFVYDITCTEKDNMVVIDHGTYYTWYVHIKQNSVTNARISEGRYVQAGTKIAEEGFTGYGDVPHLHFAVSKCADQGEHMFWYHKCEPTEVFSFSGVSGTSATWTAGLIVLPTDITPPTGNWSSPSNDFYVGCNINLSAIAQDDVYGSGVANVQFTGFWNGTWHVIQTIDTTPNSHVYAYTWDMCAASVPVGDVSLGMDITDNFGNVAYSPAGTLTIHRNADCSAQTTTKVWTGANEEGEVEDFLWSNPQNWSDNLAPVETDVVTIGDAGGDIIYNVSSSTICELHSQENLVISGGSLTIDGLSEVDGDLNLSGGSLVINDQLTINQAFNWSSGTLSGSGITTIASGAALTISGASTKSLAGHWLVNNGNASLSGGNTVLSQDAVILNSAGARLTVQSGSFTASGSGQVGTFVNAGTFSVGIGSASSVASGISFINDGTVQLNPGSLSIGKGIGYGIFRLLGIVSGQASSEGIIDSSADDALLDLGNYTFEDGSSVDGSGTVNADGTVTFNGSTSMSGTITRGGSGTMLVNGVLTIASDMTWTSGNLTGAGITRIAPGATLTLSGAADKMIGASHRLENAGTILWQAGALYFEDQATLANLAGATFDVQGDLYASAAYSSSNHGIFDNAGTFRKTSGNGTATFTSNVAFNNSGSVEIQSGTLDVNRGLSTGTYDIASGAILNVHADHQFDDDSVLIGSGQFTGDLTVIGLLEIEGNLQWQNALLSGTGVSRIAPGATLTLSGTADKMIGTGHRLENAGTILWQAGALYFDDQATLANLAGATFEVQGDLYASAAYSSSNHEIFDNAGTFHKTSGNGTATFTSNVAFNNSGSVEIQSGTLSFNEGSSAGIFTVNALNNSCLALSGYTFEDGASIQGSGSLNAAGTVTFNGSTSIEGTFTRGGTGIFNVTGTLLIQTDMEWVAGGFGGTGVSRVAPGATLTLSGTADKMIGTGHRLENAGTILWQAGGLYFDDQATLANLAGATFEVQGDLYASAAYSSSNHGIFDNAGTFHKTSGNGTATFTSNVAFNNSGSVEIQSGTLDVNRGLSTGTYDIASGAILNVHADHQFDDDSVLIGSGQFTGDLTVIGLLEIEGNLQWQNALLSGTGVSRIAPGATLTLSGTADKMIGTGHRLENAGTILWQAGALYFDDQATLANLAGATFEVQGDLYASAAYSSSNHGIFDNAGTFHKTSGNGTATFTSNVAFNNSGSVEIQSGTLSFGTTFLQTAGSTRLRGGGITGSLNIVGGTLSGSGNIGGAVTSAGTVMPGSSPGTLNLMNTYVQADTGTLQIEIGGATVGNGYDQLNVTGSATLAGTLAVSLVNGFTPQLGDSFEIMTFGSLAGQFSNVTGLGIAPGLQWDVAYGSTNITLTAAAENTLIGSVILEGRPAPPSPQLVVPLQVKIIPAGELTPVFDDVVTTDEQSEFHVNGLPPGTYDIYVKYARSLQLATTITLDEGENHAALGELRAGDADDNNFVNLTDFSLLAATFGKQASDSGYDERADFNGDGVVNLLDFSLLATNFGQAGDS